MSVKPIEKEPDTAHKIKEGREKWTFRFAVVRTFAAIISLAIAIVWAIGSGFAPLP